MNEYRLKICVFTRTGSSWPKILGTRGRPPPTIVRVGKTRINLLSCGVRIWAQVAYVLSQCTRLTDGRTDGRTDRNPFAIPCVALHAVTR